MKSRWVLGVTGAVAVALALAALARRQRPVTRVIAWRADVFGAPDSVAQQLFNFFGQRPSELAGCGRHRVRITYDGGPGGWPSRPPATRTPSTTAGDTSAELGRTSEAALIAVAFQLSVHATPEDTVSVRLVRAREMSTTGRPDRLDYSFLPAAPRQLPSVPKPLPEPTDGCAPDA